MKFSDFWLVGWNFKKFFISFSFKLCHTLQCHEITLPYFSSWNLTLFWQKKPIKMPNFILSISPNLHFYRLLLWLKKVTEELCLMTLKMNAKFAEKPIWYFKNDKNLVNFDASKVYNGWPKKVQRSYLSWYWRVM